NESIQDRTPTGMGNAIQLHDGRVFIVAFDSNETVSCAFIVDPVTLKTRALPSPKGCWNAPAFGVLPSMALLRDGRVLLAGGKVDVYKPDISASAVPFGPTTETSIPTGAMPRPRRFHSMFTLADGRVLVVGGEGGDRGDSGDNPAPAVAVQPLGDAEIYDPGSGQFTKLTVQTGVRGSNEA